MELQLPQAIEAEQSVLGALMKDPSAYAKIQAILAPKDFYDRKHQIIFKVIVEISEAFDMIDITILSNVLMANDQLEKIGGRVYLVELAESVATGAQIESHAKIVREKSLYRQAIALGNKIVDGAYKQEKPVSELIALSSQESVAMLRTDDYSGFKKLSEYTTEVGMAVDDYMTGKKGGITTGYQSLDDLIAGFHAQELIYVAARPAEGKTAWTYNMAAKQAQGGSKVAYFSAETGAEEFAMRALCTGARVDSHTWKSGRLSPDQTDSIALQMNKIAGWPFWLCETPRIEVNMLTTLASQLHRDVGLDIIYIDYLQLLTTAEHFRERRGQIEHISESLKYLAQRLNIPVVVCCQLLRDLEKRRNKEPQLYDLKESGRIEEDANIVAMLQRHKSVATRKEQKDSKLATVYIRKNKNGRTGQIDLYFEEKFTLFEDVAVQEEPPF